MIVDWLLPLEAMIGDEALTVDCAAETVLVVTVKPAEVPLASPPPVAASVYPVPTLSILTPAKVATPFTAPSVVVPDSVPPPGFAPSARDTLPAKLRSVLPSASCAVTWTAGVIGAPAVVLDGCTVNTSCAAAPGVMSNSALVPVVRPVAAAVKV